MGPIAQFLSNNKIAVLVGVAVISALLVVVGWGQGAAFGAMLWGGLLMYYVGTGDQPVDTEEEEA